MLTKPILYNGFLVKEEITIIKLIERNYFTEVYLLSDKRYLYLFTNLNSDEIIKSNNINREVFFIKIVDKTISCTIVNEHSPNNILKIQDNLTTIRGLDCVAGMKNLKNILMNDVINPLRYPEKYIKFKISIPNGILLYGPPGCGKTYIVKKLSEELNYHFIELQPSSVATPYVHGAVNNIARVFEIAKLKSPSIIFIDEIEGLIPKREDLGSFADTRKEEINEFLLQLNNAGENKILVVGATNRPHIIDLAILRSGRMDKRIYVGPPDLESREEMFKLCLAGRPYDNNINFKQIAEMTENYVSSDIELIVTESARKAVLQDKEAISEEMLISIISQFSVSVSSEDIKYYEMFSTLERW